MKNKFTIFLAACIFISFTSYSQNYKSRLKFFGSMRLRAQTSSLSIDDETNKRAELYQMKFRFRLGIRYYKNYWTAGARIRTGNPAYPQSSDLDLGDSFKNKTLAIDKAYIQFQYRDFLVWMGKNTLNMW